MRTHALHAADQLLRMEVEVERNDTLGDVLGVVADALEVVADAHGADDLAQIDGHRLPPGNREDRFFLDLMLHGVDGGIGGNHVFREIHIALHQRADGIRNLPLREPAHLGDLAHEFLQIGVECLEGMVDSGG